MTPSPSRFSLRPSQGCRVANRSRCRYLRANESQDTPLDLASGNGVARLLVSSGSNVNSQDQQGWTPLHSAARSGHLGVVGLLMDSGADIGMRNDSGKTPLDLAHEFDMRDVVSFLEMLPGNTSVLNVTTSTQRTQSQNSLPEFIEHNADISNDEESKSLHSALRSGCLDEVHRLLKRGADVNELDEKFQTPLDVTSKDGQLEIARILIENGADVNSLDNTGWSPLHWATRYGHIDVVRLLLDNGSNVNVAERRNFTPLHTASANGHFEMVRSLVERGANVQARDIYDKSPSQHALRFGQRKIAQLLSEYDGGT